MQSIASSNNNPGLVCSFPFTATPEKRSRPLTGRPGRYLRGAEIYAEGAPIKSLYKVTTGVVRICRVLPDGRRFITQFALPGETFGLDGTREHRFSAEAVTEVVLVAFARKDLDDYMDCDPTAAAGWQSFTLGTLAAAQDRFIVLGCRSATERVAHFLLDLAARSRTGSTSLDLPMSRYDIADYLGLQAETVSRILSTLRRAGMIAIEDNHKLHLLDISRLRQAAESCKVAA